MLTEQEIEEFVAAYEISREQAELNAITIQAGYRGHLVRKSLTEQGKMIHKDHSKGWEWKRWSWQGPSTLTEEKLDEMLQDFSVPLPIANQCATKIQASWRGHAVRKDLGDEASLKSLNSGTSTLSKPSKDNKTTEKQEDNQTAAGKDSKLWQTTSLVSRSSDAGVNILPQKYITGSDEHDEADNGKS